jgi:predicted Zn-dependent protease
MSRSPLARFPSSNGHGRGRPGLRPISRQSNLVVESTAGMPPAQLVDRLKAEARKAGKPYGLFFDQVEGGFTFTGRYVPNAFNVTPVVVYRVYADGRPMELVRGVDLIGTPLNAFGKIVATDNHLETFNGICGAESGPVPVSASSPALLVSEVEVQKKAKSQDALPLLAAPSARDAAASGAPVLGALKEELRRSMTNLQMKNEPKPYFASYTVVDATENSFEATLGALVEHRTARARILRTDVRVGDYAFDSSRFFASGIGGAMGSYALVPTDDNDAALRRHAWLLTDAAYKTAVEVFSRKKAAFQNRNDTEPVPDFTKVPAVERLEPVRPAASAPPDWEEAVKALSAMFARPEVVASDVSLGLSDGTRSFVSSEGSSIVDPVGVAVFRAGLTMLADDGMAVRDAVALVEPPSGLPARAELTARATKLLSDLLVTRAAKVGEDYSGPVLLENEAATTLVAQSLVPFFLARRAPDSDDGRGNPSQATTPYLTRIGNRVLPESFTVKDTPSVTLWGTRAVGGAYTIDDEGVKAEDVTLVSGGRLKTLLTTRTPHKVLPVSNGHARGGGPQAGVFQIESADAVPLSALEEKYLEVLKTQGRPFGYILRRLASVGGRGTLQITSAVKVTPDGREEPVRGLSIGTVTHYTFRDILAASTERNLFTYAAPGGTMAAVPTMVSVIAPSLIVEELEIQKNKEPLQKRPLVPSPLVAR